MAKEKFTIEDLAIKIDRLADATQQGFIAQEKSTDKKIDDLARITQQGFIAQEKSTDKKIDDLARITQEGFLELNDKIESFRAENRKEHKVFKNNVQDLQMTTNRIETLQKAELNRVDDFSIRVDKLEAKA